MKECSVCNRVLDLDQFHKGSQSYCKQCKSELARKWYRDNKEKVRARSIDYQKELRTIDSEYSKKRYIDNKDYYVQHNREHKRKLRDNAIDKMGGRCVHCGSLENLEFDHIDPFSKTVNFQKILLYMDHTEWDNCQLLCRVCHIKKSNEDRKLKRCAKVSV